MWKNTLILPITPHAPYGKKPIFAAKPKTNKTMRKTIGIITTMLLALAITATGASKAKPKQASTFHPGQIWPDNRGTHINAHGGGLLYDKGTYYWFGEHKSDTTSSAYVGVTCYSSKDLTNWTYRGVALSVTDKKGDPLEKGCILERPKVIHCKKTGKYVMWFHLELKGLGYWEALYGVAVADKPTGPYRYVRSGRVNPGRYPIEFGSKEKAVLDTLDYRHFPNWWTPTWRKGVEQGMYTKRDTKANEHSGHKFVAGQMARDQTVFVDDDGKAYHIYSSEENLTLQIAELTDDYTAHTGRYTRVAAGDMNEAPAIFKHGGRYWMITSGCTGWAPNEARMFSAPTIWGPWKKLPNPCKGPGAEKTFGGQSTYIFKVEGKKDLHVFMADIWRPKHPSDARYVWLPITYQADGTPQIVWKDEWSLKDHK